MHTSLIQALGIVDCVILKRKHSNTYQIVQNNVDWFANIFSVSPQQSTIVIEGQSIFLSDFLLDAEDFWNMHGAGQIESGIWTEQRKGKDYYLEAIAANANDAQYLIIKNVEQQFHQQKQTLQIARELLISNDEVVERHDYLNDRLRSILISGMQANQQLPLYEVIQSADIGVIIVDAKLVVLETNHAAYKMFETKPGRYGSDAFDIVLDLITRQYPEKERLFQSHYSFSGELYWHQPPLLHKWLKTDVKPVEDESGTVRNWIITISDVTRIKYLTQTNEELVLHDPLTGLPNRQYFRQVLNKMLTDTARFSVLSIDIVNFKNINEQFGYLEGDELLQQFTSRVKTMLSNDVFMTRVGADEFMILHHFKEERIAAKGKSFEDDSESLAKQIVELVDTPFFIKDNRRCDLSINIGIAHFPKDAVTTEELLSCANLALVEAKQHFDRSIQVYSTELKVASQRRLMLEEALKSAIENEQLELYLQPIFNLGDNKIIKAEALLRWKLNDEFVSPDEFIPIAENSGIINLLGRWVIASACDTIAKLESASIHLPISINFSPKQIHDLQLISFIRDSIKNMGISPELLELEVTESVFIQNYEKVRAFLADIKQTGLSVSVDDFGTGYSSLSYLKHLPIDTLKIDQSFISDVALNEDDQAIVGAILAMAAKLKLDVIAEGVETQSQRSYLLDNSCSKAQGFIFSRAIPVDDFIALYGSQT